MSYKAKAITVVANHKNHEQYNETIRTQSTNLPLVPIAANWI